MPVSRDGLPSREKVCSFLKKRTKKAFGFFGVPLNSVVR
jgi:hypothetical protein